MAMFSCYVFLLSFHLGQITRYDPYLFKVIDSMISFLNRKHLYVSR